MKLAKRAYVVTLILLMLVFAVSAQPRSDKDRRNTAPTVGTGGPIGGPTGLFTVYDGQTLRKGEYTVSMAWSNYDRDPGNVDISSIPLSLQIGVTDNLEFFFGTEAYRMIHTNSPRNLSGFYLPNSQFFINGGFRSPPAIILAPQGPGTSQFPNAAVFRPTGLQPFAAYPFVGGGSGRFGLQLPFFSGPIFGFAAGTNATMGPPRAGGAASAFPGIGSVFGSILPGVVLSTVNLGGNCTGSTNPACEGPVVFTTAPSYLPESPFLNRTWGTSGFNSFDAGFKWRMNNVNNAVGYGLIAFYRWYTDKAGTLAGFNQLQRGAGPGGSRGDVGVTIFADARLAEWANLSANFGYVRNSSVKGTFPSGSFTLLDRGDEIQSSIGLDLPVNKHFQYILEIRSLKYVGGRTPNAFENDPIDGIGGIRIFPRRWWGLGLAYRYHFNQQDPNSFDSDTTHTSTVAVTCRPGVAGCVPVTITNSFQGVPQGFVASTDPHGFIAQLWFGRRDKRATDVVNQPAVVNSVTLGASVITLPCRPGTKSRSGACNDNRTIGVQTSASDPENDVLTYNYTVSGGRVVGSGANVQWDLSGAQAGTYTITTGVDDGCGVCGKTETKTIRVEECSDCIQICACPTLSVSGPSGVTNAGDTMTFTVTVVGDASPTYTWTVSAGTIESGQGTASITVRTTKEMAGGNVTATVNLDNLCSADCPRSASETAPVAQIIVIVPTDVDEFGAAVDDDVKARVDNFYIQLNNNPNAQGFIINYGTAAEIKKRKAQINKAITFRKYDPSRITFVDGPDNKTGPSTKFVLVPPGAEKPTP